MTTTPTPRPVESPEDRMRHATAQPDSTRRIDQARAAAARELAGRSFGTYLDRQERDQLDARAATAEQERDDALDDLRTIRGERDALRAVLADRDRHHTELHNRINALENDLHSQTRAVREATAERDNANRRSAEAHQLMTEMAFRLDAALAVISAARAVTDNDHLSRRTLNDLADAISLYDTKPPGLGSSRRAQEDCRICAGSGDEWIGADDPSGGGGVMTGKPCPRCFPRRAQEQTQRPKQPGPADPWQPAYDAVFAQIRRDPPRAGSDYQQAADNARVWRCVMAARDAMDRAGASRAREDELAAEAAQYRWTPDKPGEQVRGEHGPEVPAEQLPAGATVQPEPAACPEPVWDGPYRMQCGKGALGGVCGTHGRFRAEREG